MRRNTHKPAPDGGGEVFDSTIEVPVTIRDPDKPIGTHVFTAMARNDAGLRWSAVTIDNGDDAKDALDRITIPQDVLDRIAPTALPRSSIVISDEPLSTRDQLSHRVRRGAEQPAAGRLHHAQADDVRSPSRAGTKATSSAPFSSAVGIRKAIPNPAIPRPPIRVCAVSVILTADSIRLRRSRAGAGRKRRAALTACPRR